MKTPNVRVDKMLQDAGYGGLDGTPRPQPTSDSFRNAQEHRPRHPRSDDIEGEAPRKKSAPVPTVVNVIVGDEKQAEQRGMMKGVQLGAKLAAAKLAQGMGGRPPGLPMPPSPAAPQPSASPNLAQTGPAPAPVPPLRRGGGLG